MKEYLYDSNEPIRLDKLVSNLSLMSRTKVQDLIRSGLVLVNNMVENNPALIVSSKILIEIDEPTSLKNDTIEPNDIDFEIVYEDEDLLVINKPAGLTVHPGAGNYNDTLVNGLIYRYGKKLSSINTSDRPGIVHRIDKDTSGLLMVAKTNEAHISLAKQIEDKIAQRSYKAIVWGLLLEQNGLIKTNIGRSDRDRTKMTVLQHGGKEAITHYKTLKILKGGLFSLIECNLETGRTHQIRVHMSHLGHSIVGDQTYGTNARKIKQLIDPVLKNELVNFHRQALHAYKLYFLHPKTGKEMSFEIDLAEDIQSLLQNLSDNR